MSQETSRGAGRAVGAPLAAAVEPALSRRGLLGLAGAATAMLTGCTALPSSGEVHESRVVATDTNALIETAPGPVEDASPEEIVRGFLRAVSAGFSDDFETARQFLTGETAEHCPVVCAAPRTMRSSNCSPRSLNGCSPSRSMDW